MASRPYAWTPLAGGDLGSNQAEHIHVLPPNSHYTTGSSEGFYELSQIDSSYQGASPQPYASNFDSGNEPLLRPPSYTSTVRPSSVTTSIHRNKTVRQRYFHGWHVGVTVCAVVAGSVCLVNLILTVWASLKFKLDGSIGVIQEGSCAKTKNLGLWLHLAINALSTLLLSASNYSMQCLSAPNRAEINKAHKQHIWLDIGVPSVRNLRRVSWRRIILWWSLALSSIPLHLMYNSAIFSTLSAQEYMVYTVSTDFLTGSPIGTATSIYGSSLTNLEWLQNNTASLTRLDNAACMRAYGKELVSANGDVLAVSSTPGTNSSLFSYSKRGVFSLFGSQDPFEWICAFDSTTWNNDQSRSCNLNKAVAKASDWKVDDQPIEYCLSLTREEHCRLQFSVIIMSIVIACNFIKTVCMAITVWKEREGTLVTLGDAISSFLEEPDETTAGRCLAEKDDFKTKDWRPLTKNYTPKSHSWFRAASLKRWMICNILCTVTIATAGGLLRLGLDSTSLNSKSISHLWKLGFGAITAESMINMNLPGSSGLLATVLIANSPQAILSFLYLTYNGLFSCMLLASEWSGFAHERKYLRVTSPAGKQRSTYRLQLPYTYGIPLLIISGTLHWLVSQSIFLARVAAYDGDGVEVPYNSISTCGYSCIAIITVICVGSIVVLGGIVNGFRRYDAGMPLVGSCSAAISAACHPRQQDDNMAVLPVKWGAEKSIELVGHCTFSSFEVDEPITGHAYAGMKKLS